MGLLTREGLLKKEKLEIQQVFLTDKNFVYVKQMTGTERDNFEESLINRKQDKSGRITEIEQKLEYYRGKLAVKTVCNEKGELLLNNDDYKNFSDNISAKSLEKIINVAQDLNKITEEDRENLVKNSEGGQTADSTSDSAKN